MRSGVPCLTAATVVLAAVVPFRRSVTVAQLPESGTSDGALRCVARSRAEMRAWFRSR